MDGGHRREASAAELRRRRANAGVSLADVAVAVAAHVARGYVHHIEHGHRWPTAGVARALDPAVGADGALAAPWAAANAAAAPVPAGPDEFERFERALAHPRRTDAAVVEHLRRMLAEQRRAEDALGARRLLPPVLAQIEVTGGLARDARSPVRRELLEVGSHYRQFAAWMAQDAMDTAGAQRHYDAAMEAAQEIGDADMITSVLSLKSHLAWSVGNAARAVGLAEAGQRTPGRVSDAVLGLIAQQEARGHALDGDDDATERALDRSTALTHAAAEHPEDAPPWVYFAGPDRLAYQRGVAYVELGRHGEAAPLLAAALNALDGGYDRAQARYAAVLALALAGAGEADAAVVHAKHSAELAAATGSALAARELRRVRAALRAAGADTALATLTEHLHALAAANLRGTRSTHVILGASSLADLVLRSPNWTRTSNPAMMPRD